MNKPVVLGALAVCALGAGWYWYGGGAAVPMLITPTGVGFSYDEERYGLATTPEQILVQSYIPPCDQSFDYCIYRIGTEYKGTNFESAGLSIKARADLQEKSVCLAAQPEGYSGLTPKVHDPVGPYATSVFAPLGDAAAGHYSSGALYRLSFGATCYEFIARIGESQFDNYPAGAVERFTDAARNLVYTELVDILNTVTITEGQVHILFPVLD